MEKNGEYKNLGRIGFCLSEEYAMKPEEARLMMTEPGCMDEKWVAKNPSLRTGTDSVSGFCSNASGLLATDLWRTASIFGFRCTKKIGEMG